MDHVDRDLCWLLLYTKAHAESWADINLRKQGFATLLPRVRQRGGFAPLFPRYLFVGGPAGTEFVRRRIRAVCCTLFTVVRSRRGSPWRSLAVFASEWTSTGSWSSRGAVVRDPLFARRERERVRTLVKFAQAGFRVVA